jgi:hypothetical protein
MMKMKPRQTFQGKATFCQCPRCETPMQASQIRQDCDDGYRYWSDGQADGGMFPVIVVWGRCPGCGLPFAITEASRMSPPKGRSKSGIPDILELDSECYRVLVERAAAADIHEEEKQLRIEWWHHLNDAIRPGHRRESPSIGIREVNLLGNLSKLAELLDETKPRDRILKAELFREMGEFDRCLELLADVPPFLHWLAGHISIHAASGNEQLFGLLKIPGGWRPVQSKEADQANAVSG